MMDHILFTNTVFQENCQSADDEASKGLLTTWRDIMWAYERLHVTLPPQVRENIFQ